ncbi:MAG: hypothetical protein QW814_03180 [Methanothrix sp.]
MERKAEAKKQGAEKSLVQFLEGLNCIKEKEFREFAETEGLMIKKIAEEMGLSGMGAMEERCESIYSKVYIHASKDPGVEPVSQAEYAVTRALDYFNYLRLEMIMRGMQFEAAAKNEPGVEVYLDGKKLLPPGKHKKGYSVGIMSDNDDDYPKA